MAAAPGFPGWFTSGSMLKMMGLSHSSKVVWSFTVIHRLLILANSFMDIILGQKLAFELHLPMILVFLSSVCLIMVH